MGLKERKKGREGEEKKREKGASKGGKRELGKERGK